MDIIISLLTSISKVGTTTRSLAKKLLHVITGKSELERLCDSGTYTFTTCRDIEYSLYHSHSEALRQILVADQLKIKDALQTILRVKRIIPEKGVTFLSAMPKYLRRIISYNSMLTAVTQVKDIKYDEEDDIHEAMLEDLWLSIMGSDDKLTERHTERWSEIGFQGKNPATDFRGMGILSLKNMLYMFHEKPDIARKIFGQSKHPKYGFSFAIMAINFTGTSYELLRNTKLKGYVYNLIYDEFVMKHYQDFFVELFNEFADYWVKCEPENIMAFNEVKTAFMIGVHKRLETGTW